MYCHNVNLGLPCLDICTAESGNAKTHSQLLEQQLTELRHQIRELRNKNEYLSQLVDVNQSHDPKEIRYIQLRLVNLTKAYFFQFSKQHNLEFTHFCTFHEYMPLVFMHDLRIFNV